MSLLPSYFGSGTRAVTTAGTQQKLSTTSIQCYEVMITAAPANTGLVYVGDSNTDNTYPALAAGDSMSIPIDDVSKVWVDSATNGEGVDFTYTAPINPSQNISPLNGG